MSEFDATLDQLASAPINRELLARLSGSGRSQGRLFAERLSRLPELRRLEIVASMAHYAGEDFGLDFNQLYRACLGDASPLVRRQAIEGLWEDERADLALELADILGGDPDSNVRAAAASALGRFVFLGECEELGSAKAERVREALERCIRSDSEPVEVRRRAVEAIAYINDGTVRQIIDRAYSDGHLSMRISAVFAMGRNADPCWAETAQAELYSEASAMRYEAARACGELSLSGAVPPLIGMASDDQDQEVQLMATWALGQIGGQRARRGLERLLESDNDALAEAAYAAIEELDFLKTSLNLIVVDLKDQELVSEAELDDDVLGDENASAYRRDFDRYVDEDDPADDETDEEPDDDDWPEDFLEIG